MTNDTAPVPPPHRRVETTDGDQQRPSTPAVAAGLPRWAKPAALAGGLAVLAVIAAVQVMGEDTTVAPDGAPTDSTALPIGQDDPADQPTAAPADDQATEPAVAVENLDGSDEGAPDGGETTSALPDDFPRHLLAPFATTLLTHDATQSWPDQWAEVRDYVSDRYWAELEADFETNAARYDAQQEQRADQGIHVEVFHLNIVPDLGPDEQGRLRVIHAYRQVTRIDGRDPFEFDRSVITHWVEQDGTWKIDYADFIVPE